MKSVFFNAGAVAVLSLVFGLSNVANMGATAHAAESSEKIDANYYSVSKMTIEELQKNELDSSVIILIPAPEPKKPVDPSNQPSGIPELDLSQVVLSKIINMGKQVWDVVASNKPVVNVKTDMASALPFGINTWENLSNWAEPQVRDFRVTYQNFYGDNVVDFKFRVLYTHGGMVAGKGAYLTNATIIPASLNVAWGFTFNAQSTIANVMNAGSATDPVAAMQLNLHWSIDTILKHTERTENFYIKGNGAFKVLGSNGQVLE